MKLKTKHIIFWRVILLLFLFSNSGFTMLLTTCKMENSSCCADMKSPKSCNTPSKTSTGIVLKSNNVACMETKLVGGSTSTKQAVVEIQFHIPSLKEISSFVLSINSSIFSQFHSFLTFSFRALSNSIVAVEKYVLTSILRI
ncbi:MAG: hypothetical protein KGZ58_01920 [Ignavibacteriales bacterium]|nr:hypothetical protein [Ignavibacteriales bacterium]